MLNPSQLPKFQFRGEAGQTKESRQERQFPGLESNVRRKCIGAKHSTEIVDASQCRSCSLLISSHSGQSQQEGQFRGLGRVMERSILNFCLTADEAVKVNCEVCWSVEKGECWDE